MYKYSYCLYYIWHGPCLFITVHVMSGSCYVVFSFFFGSRDSSRIRSWSVATHFSHLVTHFSAVTDVLREKRIESPS